MRIIWIVPATLLLSAYAQAASLSPTASASISSSYSTTTSPDDLKTRCQDWIMHIKKPMPENIQLQCRAVLAPSASAVSAASTTSNSSAPTPVNSTIPALGGPAN